MTQRIGVHVEVSGAAMQSAVTPMLVRKAASIGRITESQAKTNVPVKSGNLGRETNARPPRITGPFRVEVEVVSDTEYAAAVHEGSKPHVIRAKNAKALHFFWHGREVFRASVHHPGTKARPYLRNALNDAVRGL